MSTAAKSQHPDPVIPPPHPVCLPCLLVHLHASGVELRLAWCTPSHSVLCLCGFVPCAGLLLPSGDSAGTHSMENSSFLNKKKTMYLVPSVWYLRVKKSKGFLFCFQKSILGLIFFALTLPSFSCFFLCIVKWACLSKRQMLSINRLITS